MILNYLPAGGNGQLPPIPDKAFFTYETYDETVNGEKQTYAKITSTNFTSFTGESITMPNVIDDYVVKKYSDNIFQTATLGNVKKIYFTNTDYSFEYVYATNQFLPEPIEEVYFAYFDPYLNPPIARDNRVLKKFEAQNKNSISRIKQREFQNCSNLNYNPFPFASICEKNGFDKTVIKTNNLDNFLILNESSFEECRLLTNPTFNGVSNMQGNRIFYNCSNMETIELKNVLTINGNNIFAECVKLNKIYLDNLESLNFDFNYQGNSIFYHCSNLQHIYTRAENVENLKNVFLQCTYAQYGTDLADLVEATSEE